MGILNANEDPLRGDKLKYDPLKTEYDPVGKAASNRIRTYDKDLGFALHPEEKESVLKYKGAVDSAVSEKQGQLNKYKTLATGALTAADDKAQGILGQAQDAVNNIKPQDLNIVSVNVLAKDGTVEGTYYVPKDVATGLESQKFEDKPMFNTSWGEDGKSFNISVEVAGGHIAGKELHESLLDASEQTTELLGMTEDNYNTAKEVGQTQVDSLSSTVETQSGIAWDAYNQSVNQGNQVVSSVKAQWTTFIEDQQVAFQKGVETNDGGIADLLNSGALIVK